MSAYAYDVRLRGTWERASTQSYEITDFRKSLRANIEDGYVTAVRRLETRRYVAEDRYGTFDVVMRVFPSVTYGGYRVRLNERTVISRAKRQLKDIISDLCCIPPKFKVTKATSRRVWVDQ